MARRIDVVLEEILEAISGIESAVGFKLFGAFSQGWHLQRGIERGLEIISEAVRHVPDELLVTRPEISWADITRLICGVTVQVARRMDRVHQVRSGHPRAVPAGAKTGPFDSVFLF